MSSSRAERIAERTRHPHWKNAPLRIEELECINCDKCIAYCPPQFGAIFKVGIDVVIIPELCSGCDKCLPACPVDCILPIPVWAVKATPADWWAVAGGPGDPYL